MNSAPNLFLVFFSLFLKTIDAGYEYHNKYWVVDQGTCKNSYGETYFCIHYSNCYPKGYFRNGIGESKVCGFHRGKVIMCCTEEYDGIEQDDFVDYFFQNRKFPFTTTRRSTVVRSKYGWTSFWNGYFKVFNVREDVTNDNGYATVAPIITSSEGVRITQEVYTVTDAMVNDEITLPNNKIETTNWDDQNASITTEAYIPIGLITNSKEDDLAATTDADAIIQQITTNIKDANTSTTPMVDEQETDITNFQRSKLATDTHYITTTTPGASTSQQNIFTEKYPFTQGTISTTTTDQNISNIIPEETTIANFENTTAAFTSALSKSIRVTDQIIQSDGTVTEEVTTTEFASAFPTTIQDTPAVVVPLRSVNVNIEESIANEDTQFGTRSLENQIEPSEIQQNIDDQEIGGLEMDNGINIPKYAPILENSTSLRKCRDMYTDTKSDMAWYHRRSSKALLGYGDENNIQWLCGGALISEIFVLTAASCQCSNNVEPARFIRLGSVTEPEHQLIRRGVQNFAIADFIVHPLYDKTQFNRHDLALVKLNTNAIFSDYVKPACLPTEPDLGTVPLWLPGDAHLHFIHIPSEICTSTYNVTETTISQKFQICAVTDSFLKCQYDFGSPLLHVNTQYGFGNFPEIRGIASYGDPCGDKPAVCTKVLAYVAWIESMVWPEG